MAGAIYSGSFDPVTLGHLDIIRRARRAFDPLRVVVGNNPAKRYVFTLEERARFLRHELVDLGVEVHTIENQLLADYAYEAGFPVVVKGVRGIQDYDYERMMHEINLTQQRGIDTHVLLGRRELAHVSSSAVKELCRYQGFTHEYVPLIVKEALERRLNEQVVVGVTGGIACGKSHLARDARDPVRDAGDAGARHRHGRARARHPLLASGAGLRRPPRRDPPEPGARGAAATRARRRGVRRSRSAGPPQRAHARPAPHAPARHHGRAERGSS